MADVKLCIGHKGKSYNLNKDNSVFIGKKINDKIHGDVIGFTGYELQITGGSNNAGFPMRFDVSGIQRKKILFVKGVGTRNKIRGKKVRKTVTGNTVSDKTAQINLKIIKEGPKPVDEILGLKKEEQKEKVKETKKSEEKPAKQPKK